MKQTILLIGKPNSGKSLLFQKVTGLYQKVANFPGVTVEVKKGESQDFIWLDFPGTYGLSPITHDEEVAIDQFKKELSSRDSKVIVCLLDATQLERSLVLALQAQNWAIKYQHPIIFAINMIDELTQSGTFINFSALESELKAPVIGISAKTGEGIAALYETIKFVGKHYQKDKKYNDNGSHQEIIAKANHLSKRYGVDGSKLKNNQSFFDKIFLSTGFGGFIFFVIMFLLFQSIFTWATPVMEFSQDLVNNIGIYVFDFLGPGTLKDFIHDAIFGGFGSFIVFAPQIAVLTFIIGLLEDSGYLARASVIAHRPFSFFGLSGKSFVPFLSAHACAIPAIMAARTIDSPKKRFITILIIPFITCSARLPVYALLVSVFIPNHHLLGGLVSYQGMAFFILYCMGIVAALTTSLCLNKFLPQTIDDMPFVIELPRYRMPSWKPLLRKSIQSAWFFIKKAGPIIFMVNLVIWSLGHFPVSEQGLNGSYLASIGNFIGPIFKPLGLDWRYGVAILVSFLAREVFVGTLGTLYGIESADENVVSLVERIQADGLPLASGLGLIVFYALAMQCVSTLAVINSETGSKKISVVLFIGYTILAYVSAWITYISFSYLGF